MLKDPKWPEKFPFPENAFKRYDEENDTVFYERPRYVYHIDEGAVGAVTKWVVRRDGMGAKAALMCVRRAV